MRVSLIMLFILMSTHTAHGIEEVDDLKKDYEKLVKTKYVLLPHRNTFLLPYVYNWMPYESLYQSLKNVDEKNYDEDYYKRTEAEFQISFAFPVWRNILDKNWDFMMAYTHHAWWQVYNGPWSKPFRETNYTPEMFTRHVFNTSKNINVLNLEAIDIGYVHQSNGQIQILSRSWNRIFARAYLRYDLINILISGWYRLPEKNSDDDNPDIYNFMGLGQIELIKSFGKHMAHFSMPLLSHHFSPDLKYSYPLSDGLRWYLSYQSGYGHSLIEYDRPTQRLGVGITLETLFSSTSE